MYFSLKKSSHLKTLDLIVVPAIFIVARFNDGICAPERWGSFVEINNTKFTRWTRTGGILNLLFEVILKLDRIICHGFAYIS